MLLLILCKVKKTIKKWILADLVVLFVVILYYAVLYINGQTCLIKWLFNFECPTCGMTRAICRLIVGDIKGYIDYNFLALPTAICFYACLHASGRVKKWVNILTVVLAVGIIIKYFFI